MSGDFRFQPSCHSSFSAEGGSAGATLTLTEGSRSTSNGNTSPVAMNNSGLRKDKVCSLLIWQLGRTQGQ